MSGGKKVMKIFAKFQFRKILRSTYFARAQNLGRSWYYSVAFPLLSKYLYLFVKPFFLYNRMIFNGFFIFSRVTAFLSVMVAGQNFHSHGTYPTLTYPHPPCEVDGFFAPIKYNPTVMLQKHTVLKVSLTSACMKCGICIVVSEKLDQILNFAMKSAISLEDFDNELSSQLLRPICDYAFHSYELKEWEGLRFISQYPFLDNVPNSLEGQWSEILKRACHFYLNHFGEDNLVKIWLYESRINVTSLLCRNDGLFRDCSNINQGTITVQFPSRFLFPANYVQVNYACA